MPFEMALIYPFDVFLCFICLVNCVFDCICIPNCLDMGRKRKKVHVGRKEKGKEPKFMHVDVILKLPDHIIHHILSFVPIINVVLMSLLSRHWRRMWCSIPTLELSDDNIENEFSFNFVEQCLKNHKMGMQHDTNSVITRFKVEIYYNGRSQFSSE